MHAERKLALLRITLCCETIPSCVDVVIEVSRNPCWQSLSKTRHKPLVDHAKNVHPSVFIATKRCIIGLFAPSSSAGRSSQYPASRIKLKRSIFARSIFWDLDTARGQLLTSKFCRICIMASFQQFIAADELDVSTFGTISPVQS